MLEHALAYTKMGWSIIPLHSIVDGSCTCGSFKCAKPGKHPRVKWRHRANTPMTEEEIRDFWTLHPESNIGVVTGAVSGLAVLDVDAPGGLDSLASSGIPFDRLPPSPTSQTGGGGFHVFYRFPEDYRVGTAAGVLPDVDIRAEGGLIVLPPSIHASGNLYRWLPDRSVEDLEPGDLDWDRLIPPRADAPRRRGSNVWYEDLLQGVGEGQRNDAAARLAGRYIGAGLSEQEVIMILLAWNQKNEPQMEEAEVVTTVRSIHNRNREEEVIKSGDLLRTASEVLKVNITRVARITGDEPKYLIEFSEGSCVLTTAQLLSPASFQQAVCEATKRVVRRLSSKSVPTHDRLAQMLLSASEDMDAGDEATGVGELMLQINDYLSSQGYLVNADHEEIPPVGPFLREGMVWLPIQDLIQHIAARWGGRPAIRETAQRMKRAGLSREEFSSADGSRSMWGIRTDRVRSARTEEDT